MNPIETSVELLLFAGPQMGHLLAEVELARHLTTLDSRLSIAILIPKLPTPNPTLESSINTLSTTLSLDPTATNIHLISLPPITNIPPNWSSINHVVSVDLLASLYVPIVKQLAQSRPLPIAGIIFDMFSAPMIDVADDLGVPSYLFYTSGANMLSATFLFESLWEPDLPSRFSGADPESTPVNFPGFRNPVPRNIWPVVLVDEAMAPVFMRFASQYRRARGILVNTFEELESDLLLALSGNEGKNIIPPVYAVGPIVHVGRKELDRDSILSWLDGQAVGSVVFLCFGSHVGSFDKAQVEQIAIGLERSGCRFVWVIRDTSLEDILPEGFIERTTGLGKVIGWAPQTEILAHHSVGAFVSHCGWNSTLESLWFGVPIVTWPMYAEQQLNAFLLTKELGLAVNLRMDYQYDFNEGKGNVVVDAAEVEDAIRWVMKEEEGEIARKKVKEMSEFARKAVEVGGSSSVSLSRFVGDVFKNLG